MAERMKLFLKFEDVEEEYPCKFSKTHVFMPKRITSRKLSFEMEELCKRRIDFNEIMKSLYRSFETIETPLEKRSHELSSKLRTMFGLPKAKGDPNALADLDGFLADLAEEGIDSSELVRKARSRE